MERPDLSETEWLETSDGGVYVWDKNSRLFRVSEKSFEEVTELGVAVRMAFKSAKISGERAKEMAPWVFEGFNPDLAFSFLSQGKCISKVSKRGFN